MAALCVATPALGQRPISYDSLAALEAPAPTTRIAYGPGPMQFGNLRVPKGPGPHPVVLFIHGGCFLQQYTIAHAAALEQAFADSGYAVWSIEYRRVGDEGGGWPGTFEDVGRAADHLREMARTYPSICAAWSPRGTRRAAHSRCGWPRGIACARTVHSGWIARFPSARCSRSRRRRTSPTCTRRVCAGA